jgi:hypothetical protein
MSKGSVVGSFNIEKASAKEFSMQMVDSATEKRSFSSQELSQSIQLNQGISQKLSPKDLEIWQSTQLNAPQDAEEKNYQDMQATLWVVQFPGEEWEALSLKQLQQLYLKDHLPTNALICSFEGLLTLEEHIQQRTPLFRALDYVPTLKSSPYRYYFSPDLSDPAAKSAYELCEQSRWSYVNDKGEREEVNFKTLHRLFLQGKPVNDIQVLKSPSSSLEKINEALSCALTVKWEIISPTLIEHSPKGLAPFTHVQAKPFIKDMLLMHERAVHPHAFHAIFQRLTLDAEFNSLLTGEVQLADLHDSNLGVAPQQTEAYQRFKDMRFTVMKTPVADTPPPTDGVEENRSDQVYFEALKMLFDLTEPAKPSPLPPPLEYLSDLMEALNQENDHAVLLDFGECVDEKGEINPDAYFNKLDNYLHPSVPHPHLMTPQAVANTDNSLDLSALNSEEMVELVEAEESSSGSDLFKGVPLVQLEEISTPVSSPLVVKEQSFQGLLLDYLDNKIPEDTIIQYEENKKIIQQPLRDLPELQKALEVPWRFVLFDTDLALTEGNDLQQITIGGKTVHMIPLRSVLLEVDWKDQPLRQETLQRLMDSEERDLKVQHWIKKMDAPIRKKLSQKTQQTVDRHLEPVIAYFSLSRFRPSNPHVTIQELKTHFAKALSDMAHPSYLEIWLLLEKDLSTVTIRPNDSLETIAQRYQQDPQDLRMLNPYVKCIPGQQLRIRYDLTSSSPEALAKRKLIAAQLFPRLTSRQQNALLERQQRRKDYLNHFHALFHSTLEKQELYQQIQQFLERPETPLSSIRRHELLNELKSIHPPQALESFKKALCNECYPTYFNLMKAMHLLLADVYALNAALYPAKKAGENIGYFNYPLETVIQQAKSSLNPSSPAYALALSLEAYIGSRSSQLISGI